MQSPTGNHGHVGTKRGKRDRFTKEDRDALALALEHDPEIIQKLMREAGITDIGTLKRVVRRETHSAVWLPLMRALLRVATDAEPYAPDERAAIKLFRRAKYALPAERDNLLRKLTEIAVKCEEARRKSADARAEVRRLLHSMADSAEVPIVNDNGE